MLIAEKNGETLEEFWRDEYENTKTLLVSVEKAIHALTVSLGESGGVASYRLDTGQTSQSVTRADLPALVSQREKLLLQLDSLERRLGLRGKARQIVPSF